MHFVKNSVFLKQCKYHALSLSQNQCQWNSLWFSVDIHMVSFRPRGWSSVCSTTVQEDNGYQWRKRQNQSTESYIAEMWPASVNIKLQREMGLQLVWLADHHLGTSYFKSKEILLVGRNYFINQIVFPCSYGRSLLIILKSWSDDQCTYSSLSWIVPWHNFGWSDF